MKLKLIRAGGFVGKTIVAEEDVSNFPDPFLQHLEKIFTGDTSRGQQPGVTTTNINRDQFQYFVEFNGKRLSLEELPPGDEETDAEFGRLLIKLKERMHF